MNPVVKVAMDKLKAQQGGAQLAQNLLAQGKKTPPQPKPTTKKKKGGKGK